VAQVMNLLAGTLEKELMQRLSERDSSLSEQIKDLMFVFEDIVKLTPQALQRLLRDVQSKTLAMALKAATDELKEKIRRPCRSAQSPPSPRRWSSWGRSG
jgi:flagellar motor switch protein FliG